MSCLMKQKALKMALKGLKDVRRIMVRVRVRVRVRDRC